MATKSVSRETPPGRPRPHPALLTLSITPRMREAASSVSNDIQALAQTKPDIHIKEQDTSLEVRLLARVPGAGRDPVSAQRALPRVRNDKPCVSIPSLT